MSLKRNQHSLLGSIIAALAVISSISNSQAEVVHVQQGVQAIVTRTGLRRIETETAVPFLKGMGYQPEGGEIAEWRYESKGVIRLESLPAEFLRYKATFQDLRDLMVRWLRGFDLQAPRPALRVEGIRYQSKPTRLGISRLQSGNDGWVTGQLDGEFASFLVEAQRLSMMDRSNDWLGEFAVNSPSFRFDSYGKPEAQLKFQVPFAFRLKPDSRDFEIHFAPVQSNIGSIGVDFDFESLVLPEIKIEIGGTSSTEVTVRLRENVLKHREALVASLQIFIERYARESLPALLEEQTQVRWKDLLSFAVEIDPPGTASEERLSKEPGFKIENLVRGLEFDSNREALKVSWDVGVIDLKYRNDIFPSLQKSSRGAAQFASLGREDYDLGLAINPDIITQAVAMSLKNRNLFEPQPMEEGADNPSVLRLVSAPEFTEVSDARDGKGRPAWVAKLRFGISKQESPGIYRSLFWDSEALIEATALIRAEVRSDREIDFVLAGIEVEESALVEDSVRSGLLKGFLRGYVKGELGAKARQLLENPQILTTYELSPSYLGLPVSVKRVGLDRQGYFLVALDQVSRSR